MGTQNGQADINVELPRSMVGGLKKGPVEDLLRRIARDYARLEEENRLLREQLEAGGSAPPSGPTPAPPQPADRPPHRQPETAPDAQPSTEPPANVDANGSAGDAQAAPKRHLPARLDGATGRPGSDELVSTVIAIAHRAARELRESARDECELMIKKTRLRAERVEQELARATAQTRSELAELEELRSEIREQMRSSLRTLLRTVANEGFEEQPLALPWSDEPGSILSSAGAEKPRKHKKKHKS